MSTLLITARELSDELTAAVTPPKVLDGSWHLPNSGRDAAAEFEMLRIPTAQHWDIDTECNVDLPLPHMIATVPQMKASLKRHGINASSRIVVYDNADLLSSSLVWYTLECFGVENVSILDGGLKAWEAEALELETGPVDRRAHAEDVSIEDLEYRSWMIKDKAEVLKNLETGEAVVVDARSADRFFARAPEPREGLRSGHIPSSLNLPWVALTETKKGGFVGFKEAGAIREEFEKAGVDTRPGKKVIVTCGSGATAAVLAFGLRLIGKPAEDISLYDASWAEWGMPEANTPVATTSA